MKVKHNEIEITYDENLNNWQFELRGRKRSALSLAAAKAAIDKPPPKDIKPFVRVECYTEPRSYDGGNFHIVTATSIDQNRTSYSRSPQVWTVNKNNNRERFGAHQLFPVNEHNTKLVREAGELWKQIKDLEKKRAATIKRLKIIEAKAEPEGEAETT